MTEKESPIIDTFTFPRARLIVMKNTIINHRRKCKSWKSGLPCPDCHFMVIGKIIEPLLRGEYLDVKK